jgi:hypothetical protein
MIYFSYEDECVVRIWPIGEDYYKVCSVEQFVQVCTVCQMLNIELVEVMDADTSLV